MYNLSRQENGNLDKDNGTFIRSCFDVISRFGVCDEYLFPYDVTKYNAMPSFMAMRQAMGHKIHKAYRIKDTLTPKDRIESCIQALRANHPVVFGTQVSSSYQALSDNTIQYPPTNNIVGGHAQVIVGWIQGYFLVKNSWGTGWGMRGFSYFSPSYITWHQTSDLWVPTIGSEF